jgi:ABC-2 type transport system permease protein
MKSSDKSWLSEDTEIMPTIDNDGVAPFAITGNFSSHLLGVATKGKFTSFFSGKQSPIISEENDEKSVNISRDVIEISPNTSQIILFSSNDFLRDQTLTIANSAIGSEYRGSMDLIANTIDWALEDGGLLSIRSRGKFNRTLPSIDHSTQLFWEYLNYGLIIIALIFIAIIRGYRKKVRKMRYISELTQ